MKDRICAIIQARLGSTRLPNKVLLDLEGKNVLERVIERVKGSRLIEEVFVATTMLKEDLKIVKLCVTKGIRVYCGSENDVLDRYYQAARLMDVKQLVRITADCPLIDPKIIDEVIKLHLKNKDDYTSNIIKETFPDGEDIEIFTFKALSQAWQKSRLASEREHVTSYIRKHPEIFKLSNLEYPVNLSGKRWTLDEIKDYEFIRLIYKKLSRKKRIFGMSNILCLLEAHPEYEKINQKITRNAGYLKSLKEDGKIASAL